jgi:predicted alpha/beta-fold hydrolase
MSLISSPTSFTMDCKLQTIKENMKTIRILRIRIILTPLKKKAKKKMHIYNVQPLSEDSTDQRASQKCSYFSEFENFL